MRLRLRHSRSDFGRVFFAVTLGVAIGAYTWYPLLQKQIQKQKPAKAIEQSDQKP